MTGLGRWASASWSGLRSAVMSTPIGPRKNPRIACGTGARPRFSASTHDHEAKPTQITRNVNTATYPAWHRRLPVAAQVQIEGANELRALLRRLDSSKELQRGLRRAHKETSTLVAVRAKTLAPVRTGNLAASIRPGGTQTAAVVRAGSAKVPYAAAIHWGRRKGNVGSPPGNHPGKNVVKGDQFLVRAGEQSESLALEIYEREMAALLRLVAAEVHG